MSAEPAATLSTLFIGQRVVSPLLRRTAHYESRYDARPHVKKCHSSRRADRRPSTRVGARWAKMGAGSRGGAGRVAKRDRADGMKPVRGRHCRSAPASRHDWGRCDSSEWGCTSSYLILCLSLPNSLRLRPATSEDHPGCAVARTRARARLYLRRPCRRFEPSD